MSHPILFSLAVAALLVAVAGSRADSQDGRDFLNWQKNFGTAAGKAGKSGPGASQADTVGGVQAPAAKGSQAAGWPSKIDLPPTSKTPNTGGAVKQMKSNDAATGNRNSGSTSGYQNNPVNRYHLEDAWPRK